jgi:hypothetical protein
VLTRPAVAFALAERRSRSEAGTDEDWGAPVRRMTIPDPALPRVVLVHDSMGPPMRPLLAERCSMLLGTWTHSFPIEEILAARPDIVIEMRCERVFRTPLAEWPEGPVPVSAAAFATMPAIGPPEGLLASVEGHAGARVTALDDGGSVAVDLVSPADKLLLPEASVEAHEFPCFRIELSSPAATSLSLWYTTREQPEYRQRNVFRLAVPAGRSEHRVWLPVPGVAGRLLVRPGEAPGRYLVHALELRAARK